MPGWSGRRCLRRSIPEDRNDVLDTISSTVHGEDAMERELRVVDKADIRWITVKARTYRDSKGSPEG